MFREIIRCFINIHRQAFWNGNGNPSMLVISNNITNSENFVKTQSHYKIELANLVRSYRGLSQCMLSTLLIQIKLLYEQTWAEQHAQTVHCPRPARKETSVPLK